MGRDNNNAGLHLMEDFIRHSNDTDQWDRYAGMLGDGIKRKEESPVKNKKNGGKNATIIKQVIKK